MHPQDKTANDFCTCSRRESCLTGNLLPIVISLERTFASFRMISQHLFSFLRSESKGASSELCEEEISRAAAQTGDWQHPPSYFRDTTANELLARSIFLSIYYFLFNKPSFCIMDIFFFSLLCNFRLPNAENSTTSQNASRFCDGEKNGCAVLTVAERVSNLNEVSMKFYFCIGHWHTEVDFLWILSYMYVYIQHLAKFIASKNNIDEQKNYRTIYLWFWIDNSSRIYC